MKEKKEEGTRIKSNLNFPGNEKPITTLRELIGCKIRVVARTKSREGGGGKRKTERIM